MAEAKRKRMTKKKPAWKISPFGFTFLTMFGLMLLVGVVLLAQFYLFVETDKSEAQVPDLSGMSIDDAAREVKSVKLKLQPSEYAYSDSVEKDSIIDHTPPAGTVVKEGRTIYLTISLGKRDIQAPNVIGMKLEEARSELETLGLQASDVRGEYSDDAPVNTVIFQAPSPGILVARGEGIQLTFSKGPSKMSIEMPDLKGTTLDGALAQIDALGLKVSRINRVYSATASGETVSGQVPLPGLLVKRGSEVIIDLTLPTYARTLGEREFKVAVNVPMSEDGTEVRVIVKDLHETKEAYRKVIQGPAKVEIKIDSYGSTTVSIYFDGVLVREENF